MKKLSAGKLIKQAQKMQKAMDELQGKLADEEITTTSGGGAVKVTINLQQEIRSVKLDPEFLKEEPELIEETLLAALQDAVSQSKAQAEEKTEALTQGMGVPGMGFPGM